MQDGGRSQSVTGKKLACEKFGAWKDGEASRGVLTGSEGLATACPSGRVLIGGMGRIICRSELLWPVKLLLLGWAEDGRCKLLSGLLCNEHQIVKLAVWISRYVPSRRCIASENLQSGENQLAGLQVACMRILLSIRGNQAENVTINEVSKSRKPQKTSLGQDMPRPAYLSPKLTTLCERYKKLMPK